VAERNVDIVRGAIEAFNRGDYEAVTEFLHPEIEVLRLGGLPTVVGREAAFGLMLPDAFESQQIDVEKIAGEGAVVVVSGPFHARGAGSGIEISRESHSVFWIEDGLIKRMGTYADLDEAREAAGIEPSETPGA
jgi:ketosteroid isomerase-like protein